MTMYRVSYKHVPRIPYRICHTRFSILTLSEARTLDPSFLLTDRAYWLEDDTAGECATRLPYVRADYSIEFPRWMDKYERKITTEDCIVTDDHEESAIYDPAELRAKHITEELYVRPVLRFDEELTDFDPGESVSYDCVIWMVLPDKKSIIYNEDRMWDSTPFNDLRATRTARFEGSQAERAAKAWLREAHDLYL